MAKTLSYVSILISSNLMVAFLENILKIGMDFNCIMIHNVDKNIKCSGL